MLKVLFSMTFLFSGYVFGNDFDASKDTYFGKIDEVQCGEMDPDFVGDVCIIYLDANDALETADINLGKIAVVFDFDESYDLLEEFYGEYFISHLKNESGSLDLYYTDRITDKNQLMILEGNRPGYKYYQAKQYSLEDIFKVYEQD